MSLKCFPVIKILSFEGEYDMACWNPGQEDTILSVRRHISSKCYMLWKKLYILNEPEQVSPCYKNTIN